MKGNLPCGRCFSLRYTFKTVKKIPSALLFVLISVSLGHSEEASFNSVKIPESNGKQTKAVLTFSDARKAIEVHPVKGSAVTIPYSQIYKCSYEFTKKRRVSEGSIAMAPLGVGAVMMLTKSKSHWLEIEYRADSVTNTFLLRMDKRDYVHILEALKTHTGIDAEVLGNADKRAR